MSSGPEVRKAQRKLSFFVLGDILVRFLAGIIQMGWSPLALQRAAQPRSAAPRVSGGGSDCGVMEDSGSAVGFGAYAESFFEENLRQGWTALLFFLGFGRKEFALATHVGGASCHPVEDDACGFGIDVLIEEPRDHVHDR